MKPVEGDRYSAEGKGPQGRTEMALLDSYCGDAGVRVLAFLEPWVAWREEGMTVDEAEERLMQATRSIVGALIEACTASFPELKK